jgi:hypothetical protein
MACTVHIRFHWSFVEHEHRWAEHEQEEKQDD